MAEQAPVVYVLHGEDEFAIAQFISELEAKVGDPATAAMNVTRLDGRTYNPEELLTAAGAMPFLAQRRVVILTHPLARLTSPQARQRFQEVLDKIPPTTALVLVEYSPLSDERGKKAKKPHWLEEWAEKAGGRAYLKSFPMPKGYLMAQWIQERARRSGGQFSLPGAELLASLVGGDTRLADQEVQKLLAYVDYRRPVDYEDVESLTADSGQGDIFGMVDALGNMDGKKSLRMLERLLEQQEAGYIFGMVVRQFRLLLLTREALDLGGGKEHVVRELGLHPFVADKIMAQARRFKLPALEEIYHRLLELDEEIKTGQIPGELALETLVAELTAGRSRAPASH